MAIEIVIEDPRWEAAGIVGLAERAENAVSEHFGLVEYDPVIELLACSDSRIAALNTEFRDKPTPTNVLSWPSEDLSAETAGATPRAPRERFGETSLGDIAIAYDTCAREAAEQRKSFNAHVSHLIVHGVLHLLGYDHIRDADATLMEGLEREILGKMGYDDPYT